MFAPLLFIFFPQNIKIIRLRLEKNHVGKKRIKIAQIYIHPKYPQAQNCKLLLLSCWNGHKNHSHTDSVTGLLMATPLLLLEEFCFLPELTFTAKDLRSLRSSAPALHNSKNRFPCSVCYSLSTVICISSKHLWTLFCSRIYHIICNLELIFQEKPLSLGSSNV